MPADQHPDRPNDSLEVSSSSFANDDAVAQMFAEAGSPPPFVLWTPKTDMVENKLIRRFISHCRTLENSDGTLPADKTNLDQFGAMKEWLMLLTPIEDGQFFRYDHYGAGISRVYGKDMGGASTRDFPGHISAFFNSVYLAVTKRRERVLTIHQPPKQVFVSTWWRMIMPVTSSDGEIAHIIALNTPEHELRPGLEILPVPVLIMDADRVVRYANKEARQFFDNGSYGPWSRRLFEYSGLDLEITESPEEILDHGMAQTSLCRHVKHQRIGQFAATISAALHHDTAFYVILLQPLPR